jgi:Flp pilus assembly protein TadG
MVFTFLLFLAFGLIQYTALFTASTELASIARDGVRYAAKHGTTNTTLYRVPGQQNASLISTDTAIRHYVRSVAEATSIDSAHLPDSSITITPALGEVQRTSGSPITVSLRYDLRRRLFLSRNLPGISHIGIVNASATMIIE